MTTLECLGSQVLVATLVVGLTACTSGPVPGEDTLHQDVAPPSQVFISEVMHRLNPTVRYIELYNAGGAAVGLGGFTLREYKNGTADSCTHDELPLSGSIAAGDALVIVKQGDDETNFLAQYGFSADLAGVVPSGDGDDAYELLKDGTPVDVFGEIPMVGSEPSWDYSESVAQRKRSVNGGTPTFSAEEWTIAEMNPGSPGTHAQSSLFISEVTIHPTAPLVKWVEVFNPTGSAISLSTYRLKRYLDGSGALMNTIGLGNGTIPAGGKVVVVKSGGLHGFVEAYGNEFRPLLGPVNGTGLDAFELVDACDPAGENCTRVDIYGVLDDDAQNNPWKFMNGSAQRRPSVARGSASFDVGQWDIKHGSAGDPFNHAFGETVYISEVADPFTSAPLSEVKWVELCNPTNSPINLNGYMLRRYRDTEPTPDPPDPGMSLNNHTIPAGGSFVIVKNTGMNDFTKVYGFAADMGAQLNGVNDTFELVKNGVTIDVFGVIGVDAAGKPWAYQGGSVERKASALDGQTVFSQRGPPPLDDPTNLFATYFAANWTFMPGKGTPGSHACGSKNYAAVPATAQELCWDPAELVVPPLPEPLPFLPQPGTVDCATAGTGQDGDWRTGIKYPSARFIVNEGNLAGTVTDRLTGLTWLRDAACLGRAPWTTALAAAHDLDNHECGLTGGGPTGMGWQAGDWRLPTVKELQSLIDFRYWSPALSNLAGNSACREIDVANCPIQNVFGTGGGAYWTSSTRIDDQSHPPTDRDAAGSKAWCVKLADGSTTAHFKYHEAGPHEARILPVLSASAAVGGPAPVAATGQNTCWPTVFLYGLTTNHSKQQGPVCCSNEPNVNTMVQDAMLRPGVRFPSPRFTVDGGGVGTVVDNLTGLVWLKSVNTFGLTSWPDALELVNSLNAGEGGLDDDSDEGDWRLPTIKELQSLVDFGQTPALPDGWQTVFSVARLHAFYWSSTSFAGDANCAWHITFHSGIVHFDTDPRTHCGCADVQDPAFPNDPTKLIRVCHTKTHNTFGVWPVRGPRPKLLEDH